MPFGIPLHPEQTLFITLDAKERFLIAVRFHFFSQYIFFYMQILQKYVGLHIIQLINNTLCMYV